MVGRGHSGSTAGRHQPVPRSGGGRLDQSPRRLDQRRRRRLAERRWRRGWLDQSALRRRQLDQPALTGFVTVRSRSDFERWLDSDAEGLRVEELLDDPEVWARAAQGSGRMPLDVVVARPDRDYSALYRLADVRLVRPVGVTLPVVAGVLKALRMAASLQLPVRLLPGQPDAAGLALLHEALEFYVHDTRVEAPVEFFHSLLATFAGFERGTLWDMLEQPALAAREECSGCRYRGVCASYFKYPVHGYDCTGVIGLFGSLEAAAEEMTREPSL